MFIYSNNLRYNTMKHLLITTIAAIIALTSCSKQKGYNINVTVENLDGGKAILCKFENRIQVKLDSVEFSGGTFNFKGSTDQPYNASISISSNGDEKIGLLNFILENDNINITADQNKVKSQRKYNIYNNIDVSGGKNNTFSKTLDQKYEELKREPHIAEYLKGYDEVSKIYYKDVDLYYKSMKELTTKYAKEIDSLINGRLKLSLDLIKQNPDVEYAAYILNMDASRYSHAELDEIFSGFTPDVQKSELASDLAKKITAQKAVQPGNPAPDFTLKTQEGRDFTLSSLKGKIVIVDFWASWCQPCRKSIPELKKIYAEYKDKGVEIVGVANDTKEENWKKAIQEDKSEWIHVIDVFPEKNQGGLVIGQYAVQYIPSYFLIDKEGKIVGKLEKDEIRAKLDELLK